MLAAPEIIRCGSADEVADRAARMFIRAARDSAARQGRFRVALSGGSTPRAVYTRLAHSPDPAPWSCTEVFWGDERLVPPDDPASNYGMARETLLAHVPIPPEQIHRVPTELTPPEAIGPRYEQEIRTNFQGRPGEWPSFDLVLLGVGEDGHTASLFPGSPALHEERRGVLAVFADQLQTYRVTLTPPLLNAARLVMFLVSGERKAEIVRRVLGPERHPERWPAQAIQPASGRLVWLLDAAAARLLPPLRKGD